MRKYLLGFEKIKTAILRGDYFKDNLIKLSALLLVMFFIVWAFVLLSAPASFPKGEKISIKEGMTLNQISALLEKNNAIRSPFLFEALVILRTGEEGVIAGEYFLYEPINVFDLSARLTQGLFGIEKIRITFPEGSTTADMAAILSKNIPTFDYELFFSLAKEKEGYLFPDTYFFFSNVGAKQVVENMRENFDMRILGIEEKIKASGRSLEDIVIMASLIERETNTEKDRRLVSSVLWNRIDADMLLQVDAVFGYIMDKTTFELTVEDLRIDSPHNTYKHKGLPISPIANPGIDSLKAAASPTPTEYMFFLSDRNGKMYYAIDFEGHKKNRVLYLHYPPL